MKKIFLLLIIAISMSLSYGQTITLDNIVNATCDDANDGSINISINGFSAATYTWSGPNSFTANTEDISALEVGYYNLTVTDGTYTEYGSYQVRFMDVTLVPQDETCTGASDASVDLTINSGGTGPFSYLWSTGDITEDVTNIVIDGMEYMDVFVTITDDNGCTQTGIANVSEAMEFIVTLEINPSSCGNADGEAIFSSGMQGPFDVLWSNGSTGEQAMGLSAGVYSAQVYDQSTGCSATEYFFIEDDNAMTINPTVVNASSAEANNGQISLNITGGTGAYAVVWDNKMIGQLNPNLYAGSYSVTVSDLGTQCLSSECISLSYTELNYSANYTATSGCSLADGSANVSGWGGEAPISYLWSTGGTTASISNLTAGIYYCTITDANLSTKIVSTIVEDANSNITTSLNAWEAGSCENPQGFLDVNISGGTGTNSYLWSNGSTTEDLTNIQAGKFSLLITDQSIPACHKGFYSYISPIVPEKQEICMVTVDSITDHNLVVWENVQATGVDHYNIYREGCEGPYNYGLIGTVNASEISVFEDTTALPFIQSYSYKISAVDACGNESEKSSTHRTMHLQVNLDQTSGEGLLIWGDYEGFANPSFLVYVQRPNMVWEEHLDFVNNNITHLVVPYTDQTLAYAIQVLKPGGGCDAWNGNQNKASGGPYFQASSNIEDEGMTGGNSLYVASLFSLLVDGNQVSGFNSQTFNYNIELSSDYSGIPDVTFILSNLGASATENTMTEIPGSKTITVTSQNGLSSEIYTINFTVANSDASLSDLTVNGSTIIGFSTNTYSYNIELPLGTTAVPTVTAATSNSNATFVINDANELPGTSTIIVTAEDGTTTENYSVNFTVNQSVNNPIIDSIKLFPNPSAGEFTIKGENIEEIRIYAANGKTILILTDTEKVNNIDLSKNKKGIYLVKIISKEGVSNLRLVVK